MDINVFNPRVPGDEPGGRWFGPVGKRVKRWDFGYGVKQYTPHESRWDFWLRTSKQYDEWLREQGDG